MDNLIEIVLIFIYFAFCVASSEWVYKHGVADWIARKIAHVLACLLVVGFPWVLTQQMAVVIGFACSLLLVVGVWQRLLPSLTVSHKAIGTLTYPLGLAAAAALTSWQQPLPFQLTVLILGFADAGAGIIGTVGKHQQYLPFTKKTVAGSVYFFLITTCILLLGNNFGLNSTAATAVAVAAVLTTVELYTPSGWDNLSLPIIAVCVIQYVL